MFQYSHIFLVASREIFSPLFFDALAHKTSIEVKSICVVVFQSESTDPVWPQKVDGITYIAFDDADASLFNNAKTITYFSLSCFNSTFVKQVIELGCDIEQKTYMFITDDEVERWLKCIEKHGAIVEDQSLYLSADDVWVLGLQRNFITLDSVFRSKLETVLGSTDIKIIDAGVVFDILPTKSSVSLEKSVRLDMPSLKPRIMLGTKPSAFSYKEIKSMLTEFVATGAHVNSSFIVMWPKKQWRTRVMLELYLFYLRKVKKQVVDLSMVTSLPPLAYTALVMSATHLVLQPRGGASTARLFAKWRRGAILTSKESYNFGLFNQVYGIEIVGYGSLKELAQGIGVCVDTLDNAKKLELEERRSLQYLDAFYS
ncbi:hypothetical protein AB4258_08220 [Vibrio splendidus]